jgi:hypothetical protein
MSLAMLLLRVVFVQKLAATSSFWTVWLPATQILHRLMSVEVLLTLRWNLKEKKIILWWCEIWIILYGYFFISYGLNLCKWACRQKINIFRYDSWDWNSWTFVIAKKNILKTISSDC